MLKDIETRLAQSETPWLNGNHPSQEDITIFTSIKE